MREEVSPTFYFLWTVRAKLAAEIATKIQTLQLSILFHSSHYFMEPVGGLVSGDGAQRRVAHDETLFS